MNPLSFPVTGITDVEMETAPEEERPGKEMQRVSSHFTL